MQAIKSAPRGGLVPLSRAQPLRAQRAASCSRPAPALRPSVAVRAQEESVAQLGQACSIDDMSGCSLADLEMMYVDSLWSFYKGGDKFKITDEQYDMLKEELNWQGSGFPTLRRYEVAFVEASIAFAQGTPVVSDEEYDELKKQVKEGSGKRSDVTALLLYVKGQQLLEPDQYEQLAEEMRNLGIDVGIKGASCTLSKTPEELTNSSETLLTMVGALAALPFLGSSFIWAFLNYLLPIDFSPMSYLVFVGGVTTTLTLTIMNVAELFPPTILTGQCPCCETEVKAFYGKNAKDTADRTCPTCGTTVTMDKASMKLSLKDGPKFV